MNFCLGGKESSKRVGGCILIPIPKKGNLRSCDNWHSVALLEAVDKVVTRINQGRLQQVAETQLPESQCGFRRGRGCTDMTSVVRQPVEKAVATELSSSLFL